MILGLDISTTVIGVALIDEQGNLVLSEHWDISKQDTLFEKAEVVGSLMWELRTNHKIDYVFVETALKKFFPGKSRADTIVNEAPAFVNVNTARTLYGLSFPRGTKGPQRKKMVIEAVKDKEKTAFQYEMARGGKNYKKGTDDRADAVVIARAGEFLIKNANNKGYLTDKITLTD
jgi:hypothetical protein